MAGDADFNEQIVSTLHFEGGYVNDPDDTGGETNFGISKRAYPHIDIANLTKQQATDIYYRDYWLPLQPDKLPRLVAMKLFDLSVTMGHYAAIRVLQTAYNKAVGGNDLIVDGILGPRTIAAANKLNAGPLLKSIRNEASRYYTRLAELDPVKQKYIRGWLRRANA